ncbi:MULTISPECIES: ABC transporter permease [Salinivibrio]|uniref:Iron chelate uptake ABC transporter family permease subunit n=1 Tax=Salinivibrio proteolyticus TaxID=334715 RepID=A0ABY7LH63_9GAMM|nr:MULTISPECIES: iron chelate uptake ABC transporter family permease subunit [Salinivibrio]ODQ01480.1 iron ABC transporter [Salinivibrio sp. DV]OOF10572.1 iron ABC transporter [Salinivibrio sp. PR5]OOF13011.1 iron ABC transporter [Salinivibrio sp. PR919]OOF17656.1 iron ABC transporter [Salinivibrio sp. PR932]OOF20655.1 iron ABC transporter [Salinivibrio sp. IB574]
MKYLSIPVLVILALLSISIGVAHVSIENLLAGDAQAWTIFTTSRIPRLLAICLAGAGLSVAGLIMQQICQNRFASPDTTGTIDCALLGYVLTLVVFAGASQWLDLAMIVGTAMAGTWLFVRFLQRLKFKNTVLVPLIGIMYGNVVSSLTQFLAYKYDLIQTLQAWTVANFSSVLSGNYEILFVAVPVCAIAYAYASQFSAASIGESFAKNIGLDYQKVVLFGVMVVALLSSAVVMIVGVIPFLGLIVPNVVSLFMGDNIKRNLPWTAFWGVVLVLSCDILGRVLIFPYEVPIAMIISILGGAVFIYLVMRDKANA